MPVPVEGLGLGEEGCRAATVEDEVVGEVGVRGWAGEDAWDGVCCERGVMLAVNIRHGWPVHACLGFVMTYLLVKHRLARTCLLSKPPRTVD